MAEGLTVPEYSQQQAASTLSDEEPLEVRVRMPLVALQLSTRSHHSQ